MTEFKNKLGLKLSSDDISKMFEAIDIDNSGSIDYSEFIAAFLDTVVIKQEKYLKEAFQRIDSVFLDLLLIFSLFKFIWFFILLYFFKDNSGKISKHELKELLGSDTFSLGKLDINELITQADKDNDGEVNYKKYS